jgi:hypothetical protein
LNRTDELPEFPGSRNLLFDDKALLETLFKEMQPQMSELTFTNLFVWNEVEPVQLSRLDETVLLQRKRIRDGRNVFLPPLGKEPIPALLKSLKRDEAKKLPEMLLYGADLDQARQLRAEGFRVDTDRDDWDYVYLTSDLADLPGDKYHSKRNFITRCLSAHKCDYVKINADVVGECLQLQTEWCDLRKCDSNPGLEAENRAIKTIFDNYAVLNVSGSVVYVDGRLEAFTLAEPLNNDTAVIHFEKANPEIIGLYQLINQWFCQNALKRFRFVNREQDLGVPGLRNAKLSYHPHHMVEKYVAFVS